MIRILSVPIDEDLTEFTQFLWQHDIPHRVAVNDGNQEIWLPRTVNPEQIIQLYNLWKGGGDLSKIEVKRTKHRSEGFFDTIRKAPVSTTVIGLSLFISLITGFGTSVEYLRFFTFTDIFIQGEGLFTRGLLYNFESMQLWRFISPIFIHFSVMHIVFNALWIWIVGTRMEVMQGYKLLLGLIALSAVVSNFSQYWVSGPMFGGLSGVVFAFLGYAWLWDKLNPEMRFGLPTALMGFMIFWLVLGFTGALESLGFGAIANTAHLLGLLSGLIFASIATYLFKR